MSGNPHLVTAAHCAGPNCLNVRREANHWFVVEVKDGRFSCWPFDKICLLEHMKPVCGRECAQRLFEQFLSKKEK
jgi:hypothetical protein